MRGSKKGDGTYCQNVTLVGVVVEVDLGDCDVEGETCRVHIHVVIV